MDQIAEGLRQRSYVVLRDLLSQEELCALKAESDWLFARLGNDAEQYEACGCALDFMSDLNISERDPARFDAANYLAKRWQQQQPDKFSDQHKSLIAELLLDKLPAFIRAAATKQLEGTDAAVADVRMFNEQYITKPPTSEVNFRWHTDADEQLAMIAAVGAAQSATKASQRLPIYYSFWIALDDCDEQNGCLRVQPQHMLQDSEIDGAQLSVDSGVLLPAAAGDGVLFTSRLWHCSGPNTSAAPRRAFYAQYTCGILTADGRMLTDSSAGTEQVIGADSSERLLDSKSLPLAFAVQCSAVGA